MTSAPGSGIGLLLVAHAPLASAVADAATAVLGQTPLATIGIDIANDTPEPTCHERLTAARMSLGADRPVLVLVDVAGASPCNITQRVFSGCSDIRIVAGLSLAMLLRVYNYSDSGLDALADIAAAAGPRTTLRLRDPSRVDE